MEEKGEGVAHYPQCPAGQKEEEEGLKATLSPDGARWEEWRWVYFLLLVLSDWLAFFRFAAGYLALFPNQ